MLHSEAAKQHGRRGRRLGILLYWEVLGGACAAVLPAASCSMLDSKAAQQHGRNQQVVRGSRSSLC